MPISRTQEWFSPRRFGTLLGLLLLASFPQIFLGLQTFVHRDFGYFSYPIAQAWHDSFWRGEIPLWNPLSDCGTPFLGQWNTQVLYPPTLFYLLLPLSWAFGVFCAAHLFLAGMGMYFLARQWTGNNFAAAFAGVTFAFNGLLLNSLMWPSTLGALGWMPWVVWLITRVWSEGGRTFLQAVIVSALQMLTGGAEVILLTWALLGALAIAELIRGNGSRVKIILHSLLAGLLVAGLCAAQLLPFWELLRASRGQENIAAALWPMPLDGWLNFLVPIFHCERHEGVFMQVNQYWTSSYYSGVITLALAVWALGCRREVRGWLPATFMFTCLLLAFGAGSPVYGWLAQHTSALNLMRFPIKFVIVPVFFLPLLAAVGVAEKWRLENPLAKKTWLLLLASLITLIAVTVGWDGLSLTFAASSPEVFNNGLTRVALLGLIALGLFIAPKILTIEKCRVLQTGVLLLVWFDLFCSAPLPATVSRDVFEPGVQSHPRFGEARAAISPLAKSGLLSAELGEPVQNYVSRRFALFLNCNLLDAIPKTDGFFSLELRDHVAVFAGGLSAPMLDFVGAEKILNEDANGYAWSPRKDFLPLLTAGQQPVFVDDAAALPLLAAADFNPRSAVLLPPAAHKFFTATAARVKISKQLFSAPRIEAEVEAETPAVVVMAQTFYPSWRAYVDGQPVRLWHANLGFQALEVPAGRHQVKWIYEDRPFRLGAVISLVTLAGCLLAWWRLRKNTALGR